MIITRAKGGAEERKVELNTIVIPDLWHLAMWLKDNPPNIKHHHIGLQSILANKPVDNIDWCDIVLEAWHLAHDLKQALQDINKQGDKNNNVK